MTTETEQIFTELQQSNGQIQSKAFIYKVKTGDTTTYVTVVAVNSSSARQGLSQQFQNATVNFLGVCDHIMQVNG